MPTKKLDRDALCRELLTLAKKNESDLARMKEIKSDLLAGATENDKVKIPGLGVVKISAPKPKECTGIAPELKIEIFLALEPRERKELIKRGLVIEAEQWKGAYYGGVTPELFT
ncbi:MAG TPA: hypothetical protein VHY10_05195 [Xanthobacteraceae bacterium]|nr:hypothetical protein [Xanthobacteraceae bacterium]